MGMRLNRQLLLEAPQRAPDGAGGFSEVWTALGTVWAEIRPRTGRESAGVAMPLSRVGYRIILRAAPVGSDARPKPEQRFREGARVFRILSVTEFDRDARFLVCEAQEETIA